MSTLAKSECKKICVALFPYDLSIMSEVCFMACLGPRGLVWRVWLGPFREAAIRKEVEGRPPTSCLLPSPTAKWGSEKTRGVYSAVFWVWMRCHVSTRMSGQALDSCVCSGFQWQENELEKAICDQPFRSSFWVLSYVLFQSIRLLSLIWPQCHVHLRWGKNIWTELF